MKHLLFLVLLLAGTCSAVAQTVTSAQYCILEADFKRNDKAELKLVIGSKPPTADQATEVAQVAGMTYEVDALNYLSSHGWDVVSAITLATGTGVSYGTRYCLRRKP